jgi:hypothetical protein
MNTEFGISAWHANERQNERQNERRKSSLGMILATAYKPTNETSREYNNAT